MKTNINNTANFVWIDIHVEINRETNQYRITPLSDIYPITLENARGITREYFENDLVKGPDRFLVDVWDVGEDYYVFAIVMKTTEPEELISYVDVLTRAVIQQDLSEPAVMTFR